MGICNTVKTLSQSAGPSITGVLSSNDLFWVAFVIAGSLKAFYDLAMLRMFANKPLEGDRGAKRADEDEEAPAQNGAQNGDVPSGDVHDAQEPSETQPLSNGDARK